MVSACRQTPGRTGTIIRMKNIIRLFFAVTVAIITASILRSMM
jgi:hypothetical protein